MRILRLFLLLVPALVLSLCSSAPPSAPKPLGPKPPLLPNPDNPEAVARELKYAKKYPFINYTENALEWANYSAFKPVVEAFKATPYQRMRVVHIGDSHVQADIFTGHIRNRLQDLFGAGGRGLVFPYAAANTHAAYDYATRVWGTWTGDRNIVRVPKLPMGVMGISARTEDPKAGFRIAFNDYAYHADNTRLRIYYAADKAAFDLKIKVNGDPEEILVPCNNPFLNYLDVQLPHNPKYLDVSVVATDSTRKFFELYGLQLQTPGERGVLYNSVGINGADFQAILRQDRMARELKDLYPHLVVVDVSGNEYYAGGLNQATFTQRLTDILRNVKQAAPQAAVVVSCSQDFYRWRSQSHPAVEPAAALAKEVAFANNCAFYDYHKVAGGKYAMRHWYNYGLAKWDRIHLTLAGYTLKGELFANALLTSYYMALRGDTVTPYAEAHRPALAFAQVVPAKPVAPPAAPVVVPAGSNAVLYTIQPGDVLGSIAERYGVRVSQLQAWNGLGGSTLIKAGQQLKIYTSNPPKTAPKASSSSNSTASSSPKPDPNRPSRYTIKSGDTLWEIANNYNMSIDQICRLNGISRTTKLYPGKTLKLK